MIAGWIVILLALTDESIVAPWEWAVLGLGALAFAVALWSDGEERS